MSDGALPLEADRVTAISTASALEAEGRLVGAVRLLTDHNRTARDPEVEERLVRLRHEAFASLTPSPPANPPRAITAAPGDPGPLTGLRPEQLDPAALQGGLARHGCVLVRGLIPPDRADHLAAGIDRALDAFDAGLDGAPRRETSPWYAPFQPSAGDYRVGGRRSWVRASGGVWTADSPRMLFDLLELIDETGIGELVTAHLGERPALSANKCTLRRVPITTNTNWHQDGAFLGAEVRTLNLWLCLSRCGADAPGLDVLPRRLDGVLETGTEGALFDWSVSPDLVAGLAERTPVICPQFEAGDALLFDHLFLHRTAVRPEMTRERHAIETWFFAPSSYPEGQIPIVY